VTTQGRAEETSPSALEKRLSMYWQMEAMNVALLPAAVLITVISLGGQIRWPLLVCLAANAVLLVIGCVLLAHRVSSPARAAGAL
jgi:hypothetical protein